MTGSIYGSLCCGRGTIAYKCMKPKNSIIGHFPRGGWMRRQSVRRVALSTGQWDRVREAAWLGRVVVTDVYASGKPHARHHYNRLETVVADRPPNAEWVSNIDTVLACCRTHGCPPPSMRPSMEWDDSKLQVPLVLSVCLRSSISSCCCCCCGNLAYCHTGTQHDRRHAIDAAVDEKLMKLRRTDNKLTDDCSAGHMHTVAYSCPAHILSANIFDWCKVTPCETDRVLLVE